MDNLQQIGQIRMKKKPTIRAHALYAMAILAGVFPMLLAPAAGLAQDVLYTMEVPLDPVDPDARANAFREALDLVLIQVTGSDDAEHLSRLNEVFVNPERYVLRLRPGPDNTLIVSFDGDAIEQLLKQYHYAIWKGDRPVTLVWLAVDRGEGEREIVGADDEREFADVPGTIDRNRLLREHIEETAKRRGISVIFPLLDTEDRRNIGFGDLWGGFEERLFVASRRYGTSSILVGRVRIDSTQPSRWTYYFANDRVSWLGGPEMATGLVADTLAAQLAIPGDAQLASYDLTIDGIDSIVAYGRITQLMENLGAVEAFALKTVMGKKVEYRVQIYGDIDRLNNALQRSRELQPTRMIDTGDSRDGPMTDPNRLYFRLLPPLQPALRPTDVLADSNDE